MFKRIDNLRKDYRYQLKLILFMYSPPLGIL